jgi:putative flippase GtrA
MGRSRRCCFGYIAACYDSAMRAESFYTIHRNRIHLLVRYGISGVTGGVIQTIGLYLWVSVLGFMAGYLWGVVIAYLVALVVTFALQKYWTFRDHSHKVLARQMAMYTVVSLGNLAINALIVFLGKQAFTAAGIDFFHGWYLLVQVFAVGVAALAAFLANYRFTFRASSPELVREQDS